MANQLSLRFKLLGDAAGLTKAAGRAGKDLGVLGKTTSKISKGMKSTLAGIGLGLSFGGIVSYLKQAAEGAELARQADARVLQVAKSMKLFGASTENVTMRLSKYADTMELTTGQTAEVTKQVQATLLTFGSVGKTADKVGGIFDRATVAAADLAATGFGSAESNAVQLGKALQDPVKGITALAKAGITFTAAEKKRIKTLVDSNKLGKAQNLVLKTIEAQVGGVAEKTALSSVKIKNAFGQVSDQVGEALLPYLDKLSKWLTSPKGQESLKKVATEISNLVKEAGKLAKWAMDNKDTLIGLVATIAALKIGSGIITGYRTLLTLWKGLKTVGKLIKPPATGLPGGTVPGGKTPVTPPGGVAPVSKFNVPKLLRTGGVLGNVALVLSLSGSEIQDTPARKKVRDTARLKDRAASLVPSFGSGYFLRLKPAAPTGMSFGDARNGITAPKNTNITINVNNPKATAEDIVTALKGYARRQGRTGNNWNLGSL